MSIETPTKTTLKRDWRDLARKVIAFGVASLSTSVVIAIFGFFGVDINQALAAFIVAVVGMIAGYYTTDTVTVTSATPPIEGTPTQPLGD